MRILLAVLTVVLGLLTAASALQINLISFKRDGTIVTTCDQTNITASYQYAPSPAGPWTMAPSPYSAVVLTNFTNTARLPISNLMQFSPILFFRASATNGIVGASVYDVNSNGIPQIAQSDYIQLSKVAVISRFRSGEGHDYSDDFEHCRSMKHYYSFATNVNSADVRIFAPVTGIITRETAEQTTNSGTQVWITPTNYPAFDFVLFHVNLTNTLPVGATVTNGQPIGWFGGANSVVTGSDVAVWVTTPTGRKLLSFFQLMTPSVFNAYAARGITNLNQVIISQAARDADPLDCNGQTFASPGSITNDVVLTPVGP